MRPCVLFVEDEPTQRRLLTLLFRGMPIMSAIVGTCEDALQILNDPPKYLGPIKLVVTDGIIQGEGRMSGLEFARIAMEQFHLPVVLVSATVAELPEGVAELVPKPYDTNTLLAVVARRLALPSLANDA